MQKRIGTDYQVLQHRAATHEYRHANSRSRPSAGGVSAAVLEKQLCDGVKLKNKGYLWPVPLLRYTAATEPESTEIKRHCQQNQR